MALNQNKRLYWATQAVGFAPDGSTTFTALHGAQSMGVTTTFNLEEIFEIGQISIYDNVEGTPDIEITLEKVIDGYPLIYHLSTPGAPTGTLAGRSNERVILALSTFGDTQDSASGTPNAQMTCSGLYVSSLNYNFTAEGVHTESVTLVGNDKTWSSGSFTFTGGFNNDDSPASGLQKREHITMGNAADASIWPTGAGGGIPGIDASGWNNDRADGSSCLARIQEVTISTDLGREELVQLGRRNPFFRYATFPVEVTTEIQVLSSDGDFIDATEEGNDAAGNNLTDQRIVIKTDFGDTYDLGTKNKLQSSQFNISTDGSNNIDTYTYSNFNDLAVYSPSDPAGHTP